MAIVIFDCNSFISNLIPYFIDGDSDQLEPCFAYFKRIYKIETSNREFANLIANLQLTSKASIIIDSLRI